MKTLPLRTGDPNNPPLGTIDGIPEGVPFAVEISARKYDGTPLDTTGQDFVVTLAKSATDKKPAVELHIWDRQVTLVDAADARFRVEFEASDMEALEAGNRTLHYWTEPRDGSSGRLLQARDTVALEPAVEPDYSPPPRLAVVGFPDLSGATSATPYEIDPEAGFGGGKRPVGYVSTIDGVTSRIAGTLTLDRDVAVNRLITITAMDARGDVMSASFRQKNGGIGTMAIGSTFEVA